MKKAILTAIPMCIMNLNLVGMSLFALWAFTGMMCWQHEWARNLMIGLYIVGGFWVMAAGAM